MPVRVVSDVPQLPLSTYRSNEYIFEDAFLLRSKVNKPTTHGGSFYPRQRGGDCDDSPSRYLTCDVVGLECWKFSSSLDQSARALQRSLICCHRRTWPRSGGELPTNPLCKLCRRQAFVASGSQIFNRTGHRSRYEFLIHAEGLLLAAYQICHLSVARESWALNQPHHRSRCRCVCFC